MTHPQGVHNDIEGPYLFVGGHADGHRYSVNRSRAVWAIPSPLDPGEVDHYRKRTLLLGTRSASSVRLTVMVLEGLDEAEAYEQALATIAEALGGTVQHTDA